MYYKVCEYCGATLDAGEVCDCTHEKKQHSIELTPSGMPLTNNSMVSRDGGKVKRITLVSLKLMNFQGIRSLELDFDGRNASVYGDNATGKTTVYNAVTWLLFDKPSTGAKGYTPKTRTQNGEAHHLDHAAEAVFGKACDMIVLKKVYREVYKKKRGSVHEEFDGHTIDYYIDGVPVKEKEYAAKIADWLGADVQVQMMLTMPDCFADALSWEDRRKILLDVCGDVSSDDVIASNDELAALPERLGAHSIDDYRKIVTAQRREINDRLQTIPSRIDEAMRAMPDIDPALDADQIKSELAVIMEKRSAVMDERSAVLLGDSTVTELRRQIAAKETERAEAESAHRKCELEKATKHNERIADLTNDLREAKRKCDDISCEIDNKNYRLRNKQKKRDELISYWKQVNAESWDESESICPTCKRPLPDNEVEKLKADFNRRKSETLHFINEQGKREASAADIQALQDAIEKLTTELSVARDDVKAKEAHLSEAHITAPTKVPFEQTAECERIDSEIAACKEQLASGTAQIDVSAYDAKITELDSQITAAQELLAENATATQQRARVSELEQEQEKLTAEYESLEESLYLCDLFVKQKVSMLTDRINSRFHSVRFSLFKEQLNGGLKEECEVLIPSDGGSLVPYAYANNAARINAGLEIINTLIEHFGVSLPVFVDNAESVTKLLPINAQTIRLVVSEQDKALRVEVET